MNNLEEELLECVRRERSCLGEVLRYLRALVREVAGSSKREAEKKLAALYPSALKRERAKPISEDLVEIRLTVTREEYELIEKLLDRKAHSNFEPSPGKLFAELVKAEMKKIEGKQTEDAPPQRPGKVNSRNIRPALKRKIWKRDEARCQYISPNGHRCEERHGLQVDHIKPYIVAGPTAEENLRLLCGAHNRYRAKGS